MRAERGRRTVEHVGIEVHLIDGTYELFRQYFSPGRPSRVNGNGLEVGAARAVVRNLFTMLEQGVTHVGVATDHVIESFRNDLYDEYKDGSGIEPEIHAQFEPLELGIEAAGFAVFPIDRKSVV